MSTNHQLQHNDILQNRMGLRIAARLSAGAGEVSHDVSERLRVARQQALARRKRPQMVARNAAADAPVVLQQGPTAVLGFGGRPLAHNRFAAARRLAHPAGLGAGFCLAIVVRCRSQTGFAGSGTSPRPGAE